MPPLYEGTPLHGDRSAWNTVDFPDEHARDINDGALLYHLPIPANANEIVQSDGSNWSATLTPTFDGLVTINDQLVFAEIADPGASAANVVRLFANEKHLITLNEDDVWHDISASAHGKSSFIHTEVTISDRGGLNVQWGAGSIFDALITGGAQVVTIAAQTNNQAMTASSMNYFYFDKSAGNIAYTIDPDADIDWAGGDFTIGLVSTTHNDIIDIDQFPVGNQELHYIREILDEAFHTVVHRGLLISEHAAGLTWDIDQTAGAYTHGGIDHHNVSARSAPTMRRWFHSAANTWESDTNAEIDASNWDDDDDSAGVTANDNAKWYRSTFYTDADTTHWVYPQVEYANINAALMGIDPIPPHVLEHLPKTVTVVMRGNAAAFPAEGSDQWIDVRSILGATGAGVITDHGNLAGLDTGADHSYIDQDVKVAASPTFADVFVPDGGQIGISGNELLTFNAAGTAVFSGCQVGIGAHTEGTLHVHTASAGAVVANISGDDLVVENSEDAGISVLAPDDAYGYFMFGSPTNNYYAGFAASHDDPNLYFHVGNANRLVLGIATLAFQQASTISTTAGDLILAPAVNVGIGITPLAKLHANGNVIFGAGNGAAGVSFSEGGFSANEHSVLNIQGYAAGNNWIGFDLYFDGVFKSTFTSAWQIYHRYGNLIFKGNSGLTPDEEYAPTTVMTLMPGGNVEIVGTLTVNGDQSGATDHVFDDYDDIKLLYKWRAGEKLPFEVGDMLNRDRLLRDTIIQLECRIVELEAI